MGRRKDIFKTPEYRHIEENLDDILKELEEDEEYKDLTLPDEWDREFREVMENAQKESRKKRKHKQILAAAAVLVVLIGVSGVGLRTKVVQGDGILELFQINQEKGENKYISYGTDAEGTLYAENSTEVVFDTSNLDELNSQISDELKRPFFRITWIPDDLHIESAVYNKDFGVLNIELQGEENWGFISQEMITDYGSKTSIVDKKEIDVAKNENLDKEIVIYRSIKDQSITFGVEKNNIRLDFTGKISEIDGKKIAENIVLE